MGANFDNFDAFRLDHQNLTRQIVLKRYSIYRCMVKDSDYPSKYFPSNIWRVHTYQNFPPSKFCAIRYAFSFHCSVIHIISLKSLKITFIYYSVLSFTENWIVFWDFKVQNSIKIIEGSNNGDLNNQGPTVHIYYVWYHYFLTTYRLWKVMG